MATGTVRAHCAELMDVAHAQVDTLFDVAALLQSVGTIGDPGNPFSEEQAGRVRRVVRVAEERVQNVIAC